MKVLHLVDGYPPAGGCAGRWCQGLSRALAARGVAVQVVSATPRPDGSERRNDLHLTLAEKRAARAEAEVA